MGIKTKIATLIYFDQNYIKDDLNYLLVFDMITWKLREWYFTNFILCLDLDFKANWKMKLWKWKFAYEAH